MVLAALLALPTTAAADEFSPESEARNYSKRVINSYFVYSYLGNGTIPVVPNNIPPALINQNRCKK